MRVLLFPLLLSLLFLGCSPEPEPETYPQWYTNPPKSTPQTLYSIAIDANESAAHNSAELVLRSELLKKVKQGLQHPKHPVNRTITPTEFASMEKAFTYYASRIQFTDSNVEEVAKKPLDDSQTDEEAAKATTMVLISVNAEALFLEVQATLNDKIRNFKDALTESKQYSALHAYLVLTQFQEAKANLMFHAELLRVLDPNTPTEKYFKYLYEMNNIYKILQKEINVKIISDGTTIGLVKPISKALQEKGLQVSSMKLNAPRLFTLLLTSSTKQDVLYGFNVERLQITSQIKNKSKKLMAKNVITFEGKSRHDKKDAKRHAIEQYKTQLKQEGVFKMLGLSLKK